MGDYLDQLSEFVAATSYEDLSESTLTHAQDVVLDTLGAVVAGSRLPENADLAQIANTRSKSLSSTILGHPLRADPMFATLANATAGIALEMDEGNRFAAGHPSIHVLPGILAIGEEMNIGGKQLLEALVLGYDVESRLGAATKPRFNVHSHGHWGVIGTASAVAKLKGYDASRIRDLINVAAGMSPANSWTACYEGATIRNAYPGRSGLMGILAIDMYECGFTGIHDGPSDMFGIILGESFDPDVVTANLGNEYRIEQNYIKFHACCRLNHPAIDAALKVKEQHSFSIDDISTIDVATHDYLAGMVGEYPRNMLAAKFSVPYAVAAALVHGHADITAFYPQSFEDGSVRDLFSKIHVKQDGEARASENGPSGRISIKLKDGSTLKTEVDIVHGDYGNRAPRSQLLEKFRFLTADILDTSTADSVIAMTEDLANLESVRDLTALLGG